MADWLKLFGGSLPFKLYFFCGVWTVQMFTLVLDIKAPIQGVKLWAADGTIGRFRISHLKIHWTVRLWWQHSSGSGLLSHCSLSTNQSFGITCSTPPLWWRCRVTEEKQTKTKMLLLCPASVLLQSHSPSKLDLPRNKMHLNFFSFLL